MKLIKSEFKLCVKVCVVAAEPDWNVALPALISVRICASAAVARVVSALTA